MSVRIECVQVAWWLVNRNNALSSLHDGFWTLPALATLGLSGNPLASVSDSVAGVANTLTDLDLSYTKLKALPESLGSLTELVRMYGNRKEL